MENFESEKTTVLMFDVTISETQVLELLESFNKRLEQLEANILELKQKDKEDISLKEAAAFIGYKPSSVYQMVYANQIPFMKKKNGRLTFKKSELKDFMEKRGKA